MLAASESVLREWIVSIDANLAVLRPTCHALDRTGRLASFEYRKRFLPCPTGSSALSNPGEE